MTELDEKLEFKDICKPTKPWRMLFTNRLSAVDAKSFCQKLTSKHTVIKDDRANREYTEFIKTALETDKSVAETCNFFNVGNEYGPTFILAQHKDTGPINLHPMKDPYSGDIISFTNWYPGWPNSNFIDKGDYWHTFVYNEGKSRFIHQTNDTACCFSCDGLESNLPIVRMRGLCLNSQFDKNYILAASSKDILFYQGDRHTNITYDKELKIWEITSNRGTQGGYEKEVPARGHSKVCICSDINRLRTLLLGELLKASPWQK